MIAILSDGTIVEVADAAEALALVGNGVILNALLNDDDDISVPLSKVLELDSSRGQSASVRGAAIDNILTYIPGKRS